MFWTLVIIGFLGLLVLAGLAYQTIETEREAALFPPPGRMVKVGEHQLHLWVNGNSGPGGKPSIIFDSGLGATSTSWRLVVPELDRFTRVVTYDRAGLGWSDPSPLPRTSLQNVTELRTALHRAQVQPPYVLVGHSFGGYNCRLFASLHPEEVAGLVLVDPIHPVEWLEPSPEEERARRFGIRLCRRGARLARIGVSRAYLEGVIAGRLGLTQPAFEVLSSGASVVGRRIVEALSRLPPDLQRIVLSHWSRPSFFESTGSHMQYLPVSARQVADHPLPAEIPLTVLTPDSARDDRRKRNEALAADSLRGRHVLVRDSSHFVQLDRPDTVAEAVVSMLELVPAR